jgi:hypothetical protein
MAPTFTNISFVIQQSAALIYPPIFTVSLSYTTVPVPPGKMCPAIVMPVDYGPSFALGKLSLGTYTVIDQTTKQQVGSISVTSSTQALKDSVYVTPPNPTTKDSLHFDLFNASLSCCTQYINRNASVSDSVITLSFEYLDSGKCACLVAGSHAPFSCGPQKAGKYAIYKEQSAYCGTPPCPLVAGPIQLERVGQVVVSATNAAVPAGKIAPAMGPSLTLEKSTVWLDYTLSRPGLVRVTVFNARGALAGEICNGQAAAGVHRFSWTAACPGAYFMSVEINGVTVAARRIIISQ